MEAQVTQKSHNNNNNAKQSQYRRIPVQNCIQNKTLCLALGSCCIRSELLQLSLGKSQNEFRASIFTQADV